MNQLKPINVLQRAEQLIDAARNDDFKKQIAEIGEAAVREDAEAQFVLGHAYHEGYGVEQDTEQSVRWLRKAAEQGHVEAQYSLAASYGAGLGVE